jgi:hypothetical protein
MTAPGLTEIDTKRLLAVAMSYDNRKPSDAAVLSWGEASRRGRWTFPEAVEAVHEHYASSTGFLMPAHITQWIKAARQDAAMRTPVDPPDRTGQARLAALLAGAFQTIDDGWQDDALSRRCPSCDAEAGAGCTRRDDDGSRVATRIPHPARMKPEAEAS